MDKYDRKTSFRVEKVSSLLLNLYLIANRQRIRMKQTPKLTNFQIWCLFQSKMHSFYPK